MIAGMGFRQMLVFIFENFCFLYEGPTARLSQLLLCKGVFNHFNQLSNFFQKLRIAAPLNGISRVSWANFTRFLLFTFKMPVIPTIYTAKPRGKHVKLLETSLETVSCGN